MLFAVKVALATIIGRYIAIIAQPQRHLTMFTFKTFAVKEEALGRKSLEHENPFIAEVTVFAASQRATVIADLLRRRQQKIHLEVQ